MATGQRLAGRVAIITGAGSGIGRATALKFAGEGATVVVNDVRADAADETVALVRSVGGAAETAVGDVTSSAFVDELVNAAATRHGRLDVMHNNAGLGVAKSLLLDITDEQWQGDLDLNLSAVFYGIRAALRVMIPQGRGSIISTSSLAGLGGVPLRSAYGAAKAGVIQLTRAAVVEYGHTGVRINVIAPGSMYTPAFAQFAETLPQGLEAWTKQIPAAALGRPEDIADVALWLASDESAYVNGVVVPVDGGVFAKLAGPDARGA